MQDVRIGCGVQQGQDEITNFIVHVGLPSGLRHALLLLCAKVVWLYYLPNQAMREVVFCMLPETLGSWCRNLHRTSLAMCGIVNTPTPNGSRVP